MPKFDYMQILTESQYLDFDEKNFNSIEKDGYVRKRLSARARNLISRETNIPTKKLKVDINGGYAMIGVSAKILGVDYPELINFETFDTALENFVKYGILKSIDAKSIRENGKLVVVDVTNDYLFDEAPTLKHFDILAKATANPYRWNPRVFNNGGGGGGISLLKKVKEDKEKLIIYDKHIEMLLPRNKKFNNTYGKFFNNRGSIRAEASLFSSQSIRNRFGTNSVLHVLNSDIQPLKMMLDDLFINGDNINYKSKLNKVEMRNIAFAGAYDNNPEKIAAAILENPSNRHNRVRIFKDVMESVLSTDTEASNMLNFLKDLRKIS